MSEIRHYVITQTRSVEVSANSTTDAVLIAQAAFKYGQDGAALAPGNKPDGVWGDTKTRVHEIELNARERR